MQIISTEVWNVLRLQRKSKQQQLFYAKTKDLLRPENKKKLKQRCFVNKGEQPFGTPRIL
jgi:hypothetical protein